MDVELVQELNDRLAALVSSRNQVVAQLEQVKANLSAHNGAIEELERVLGLLGGEEAAQECGPTEEVGDSPLAARECGPTS